MVEAENHVGRPPTLHQRFDHLEDRFARLEYRVNLLFGGLGVVVVLANVGLAVAIALAVVGARGGP